MDRLEPKPGSRAQTAGVALPGSEPIIAYPQGSTWRLLNSSDPTYVTNVAAAPTDRAAKGLKAASFECTAFNFKGEPIGEKHIRHILTKPEQDVLELVAVCIESGEPRIFALSRTRPCLGARSNLHATPLIPVDGIQINLPGRYFVEQSRMLTLDETSEALLDDLGLTRHGRMKILGGSYFVLHNSGELAFPRLVEIADPGFLEDGPTSVGEKFSGRRTQHLLSPNKIVNGFLKGEITDLRLVLNAIRVAAHYDHKITVDQLRNIDKDYASSEVNIPILTRENIRALPGDNPNICARLIAEPITTNDAHHHVRTYQYLAANRNSSGENVGPLYLFDVADRKTIDYLVNVPHFFIGGELYVIANAGIRASHSERNAHPHPLHTDIHPFSIEGVFEGIPKDTRIEAIPSRAVQLLNNWGLTTEVSPFRFGCGTPSSGYDPSLYDMYATPIDPTKIDLSRFPKSAFAVKAHDVMALAQTGEIRSLELILSTMLLSASYGISTKVDVKLNGSAAHINSLEEKLSRPGHISSILARHHPKFLDLLLSVPGGQNFLHYLENEVEGTIVDSKHPSERGLFDGVGRVTSLSADENVAEPTLTVHDLIHFALKRTIIPFERDKDGNLLENADGNLIPWSKEKYVIAICVDEANASKASEITIPKLVGINRYMSMTGKPCLAEFFRKAEINTPEEEDRAVRMMVLEGKIPHELADHPDYPQYRNIILTKFLGYYPRDFQHNGPLLYDEWMKNQEQARVIALFTDPVDMPGSDIYSYYPDDFSRILNYQEGRNPLKGSISDIRGPGSSKLISQLAALAKKFSNGSLHAMPGLYDESKRVAKELAAGYRRLGELRLNIRDIERSQVNLDIEKEVQENLENQFAAAMAFCRDHWGDGQREYPASIIHPFFMNQAEIKAVLDLEAKSLAGTRNQILSGHDL